MIKILLIWGMCLTLSKEISRNIDYWEHWKYVPTVESYESPHEFEPKLMRVTCYLPTGNRTASGCYPFIGSCAGRREDIGKVVAVYDINKVFLGYLEIRDCGGAQSLQNGTSIDIYVDTMDQAKEWIREHGDYCYIQYIEAQG